MCAGFLGIYLAPSKYRLCVTFSESKPASRICQIPFRSPTEEVQTPFGKMSVHHSVCPNSVSEAEAISVVVSFLCGEELLSRSGLLHIFPAEPLAVRGSRLSLRGCPCSTHLGRWSVPRSKATLVADPSGNADHAARGTTFRQVCLHPMERLRFTGLGDPQL